jgi:hypothetical protein
MRVVHGDPPPCHCAWWALQLLYGQADSGVLEQSAYYTAVESAYHGYHCVPRKRGT